jgi:hypothetical protein
MLQMDGWRPREIVPTLSALSGVKKFFEDFFLCKMHVRGAGKNRLNPKNLLVRRLAIAAFYTLDSLMKGE